MRLNCIMKVRGGYIEYIMNLQNLVVVISCSLLMAFNKSYFLSETWPYFHCHSWNTRFSSRTFPFQSAHSCHHPIICKQWYLSFSVLFVRVIFHQWCAGKNTLKEAKSIAQVCIIFSTLRYFWFIKDLHCGIFRRDEFYALALCGLLK